MTERDVTTADGRTLHLCDGGDPGGTPVLRHAGTPDGAWLSDEASATARDHGVRLIAYDRPGYGGSTRHEGRNVADCAADVRAIAGSLDLRRLGVWGISGGGPHALASAALLDGLVPAVAALASPAPRDAPGLDWQAGMGEENIAEMDAARQGPEPLRRLLSAERDEVLAADPGAVRQLLATLLSEVDVAALTPERAHAALAISQSALASGIDGWLDDDLAFVGDWGFGLSQIRVPVLLMHGREDRFVPVGHGEWLAETIPGVDARILDGEGHISLHAGHMGEMYDWLRRRIG